MTAGRAGLMCAVMLSVASCSEASISPGTSSTKLSGRTGTDSGVSTTGAEATASVTAQPLGTFSWMVQERAPLGGAGEIATSEGRRAYLDAVAGVLGDEGPFVDPDTWPGHVAAARRALEEQSTLTVLRLEVSELVEIAGGEHSAYLATTAGLSPPLLLPEVTTEHGVSRVVVTEGGGADLAEQTVYARPG